VSACRLEIHRKRAATATLSVSSSDITRHRTYETPGSTSLAGQQRLIGLPAGKVPSGPPWAFVAPAHHLGLAMPKPLWPGVLRVITTKLLWRGSSHQSQSHHGGGVGPRVVVAAVEPGRRPEQALRLAGFARHASGRGHRTSTLSAGAQPLPARWRSASTIGWKKKGKRPPPPKPPKQAAEVGTDRSAHA